MDERLGYIAGLCCRRPLLSSANRFPLILNGGSPPPPNRNSKCGFIIRGFFIEMPCSRLQIYSSNQVLKCGVNERKRQKRERERETELNS